MGVTIDLTASDGHRFAVYRAEPAGEVKGGLIVAIEIFGVNSHIRRIADEYAANGYLVLAPALFDRVQRGLDIGYSQPDIEIGVGLMRKMQLGDAIRDLSATNKALAGAGRTAVVGFCWGGALTWKAACEVSGLACAVAYYGGAIPTLPYAAPHCPVLFHWGEKDLSIPVKKAREFAASHPDQTHYFYPAGHGFNCEQRPSFDAESAKLARRRSLEFLARYVD